MNKFFVNPVVFVSLIATLLFVSSCEKAAEVEEADLIGTWDMGQVSVDVKVGPVKLLDFLMSTLSYGEEAAQMLVDEITNQFLEIEGGTITFNADYSYLLARSQFEEGGKWRLEGDKLYMNETNDAEMDDNPLTVVSINSSAALISWEEEQEIEIEEGINPIKATIVIELNLDKQ